MKAFRRKWKAFTRRKPSSSHSHACYWSVCDVREI